MKMKSTSFLLIPALLTLSLQAVAQVDTLDKVEQMASTGIFRLKIRFDDGRGF